MEHLKKYPNDFEKPLTVLLKFLSNANVKLFNENESWLRRNWRFFFMVPVAVGHFVSAGVHIMSLLVEGRDMYSEASTIPIFLVSLQALIKILIVMSQKQRLQNIIDSLGRQWRTDDFNDVQMAVTKSEARELRIAVIVFIHFSQFVGLQYLLMPLLQAVLFNVILGQEYTVSLPFAAAFPVDVNSDWVLYGAAYVFQSYSVALIVYTYVGSDFMLIALSAHLSREFHLLQEDLMHVRPTKEVGGVVVQDNDSIRQFVKEHQKLIVLAQELDVAVNRLMFVNFTFTTLNITFFGLAALTTKNMGEKLTNCVNVISILILMLILVYFCEKLQSASADVFKAAVQNPWYDGDRTYRRVLCFIMARSQRPSYLTSLKYTKVTLQTFTKVLSTAWSYFSLVNTMYQHSK